MDKKQNDCELDENLARYVKEYTLNYVPDKDLERDILEKTPVPTNITETLKLGQTLKTFLRGKGPL